MEHPDFAPIDPLAFRDDYWRSVRWDLPLGTERPLGLSPAARAQEEASGTTLMWRFISQWIPWQYTGYHEESESFHRTAYLGDWSGLPKLHVSGPGAVEFLSRYCANSFATFEPGRIKHSIQTDAAGKVIGEGVLYRLADGSFRYSGGGALWLASRAKEDATPARVALETPDRFVFAIQGPRSLDVVEDFLGQSVRDLDFSRTREVRFDGHDMQLLRTGVSGQLGYEFQGPSEIADLVWARLADVGRQQGLRLLGGRSQLISHVEYGFATIGRDYLPGGGGQPGSGQSYRLGVRGGSYVSDDPSDFQRSPVELGWAGSVSLDHDFLGRDVLAIEKRDGTTRRLVGLEWNTEDVVGVFAAQFADGGLPTPFEMPRNVLHHWLYPDQIRSGDRLVGVSTSRVYSTFLRRMISLGMIDAELAQPGAEVEVLWGDPGSAQREIRARVRALPFATDARRTDVRALPPRSV
jgi:vanillate/3-O-methylgallate O-demethylase